MAPIPVVAFVASFPKPFVGSPPYALVVRHCEQSETGIGWWFLEELMSFFVTSDASSLTLSVYFPPFVPVVRHYGMGIEW